MRSGTSGRVQRRRAGVAAALALLLVGALPGLAGAEDTVAFTIRDTRVTGSVGLTRDVAGGLYWTANAAGAGRVFGVGPDGRVRGTLNYRAQPRDVEAVALAGNRLYVADIGDRARTRDMVTVYYLTNPRATGLTVPYNAWDFRYPDGPHDAGTLLVEPGGRLLVVTHDAEGGVYAAPSAPSATGVNRLRRVGSAPPMVTDGVVLPDGKRIALLTSSAVVVVDATTYARVASAALPAQQQAASLALDLDGTNLLVGSGGSPRRVQRMPVPGAATASPSPSTPTADDPAEDAGTAAAAASPSRRGTLLALGLAGVVAVVAGVVVAVARPPS